MPGSMLWKQGRPVGTSNLFVRYNNYCQVSFLFVPQRNALGFMLRFGVVNFMDRGVLEINGRKAGSGYCPYRSVFAAARCCPLQPCPEGKTYNPTSSLQQRQSPDSRPEKHSVFQTINHWGRLKCACCSHSNSNSSSLAVFVVVTSTWTSGCRFFRGSLLLHCRASPGAVGGGGAAGVETCGWSGFLDSVELGRTRMLAPEVQSRTLSSVGDVVC